MYNEKNIIFKHKCGRKPLRCFTPKKYFRHLFLYPNMMTISLNMEKLEFKSIVLFALSAWWFFTTVDWKKIASDSLWLYPHQRKSGGAPIPFLPVRNCGSSCIHTHTHTHTQKQGGNWKPKTENEKTQFSLLWKWK